MKKGFRIIPLLIILALILTRCEKDMTITPESEENQFLELVTLGEEIDDIDTVALTTDSTDTSRVRYLRQAFRKLDRLLDRLQVLVIRHENEEAKELYEQAREAQHSAIEAAVAGEFEEALDDIHESRDLAIEAVSLMQDEIQEDRAEIIERLREGIEETRALLDEVKAILEETEDPDPRAMNLHRRGRIHLHRSIVALRERRLRNSGYHLRRANKYARIALHILTDDGTA